MSERKPASFSRKPDFAIFGLYSLPIERDDAADGLNFSAFEAAIQDLAQSTKLDFAVLSHFHFDQFVVAQSLIDLRHHRFSHTFVPNLYDGFEGVSEFTKMFALFGRKRTHRAPADTMRTRASRK